MLLNFLLSFTLPKLSTFSKDRSRRDLDPTTTTYVKSGMEITGNCNEQSHINIRKLHNHWTRLCRHVWVQLQCWPRWRFGHSGSHNLSRCSVLLRRSQEVAISQLSRLHLLFARNVLRGLPWTKAVSCGASLLCNGRWNPLKCPSWLILLCID